MRTDSDADPLDVASVAAALQTVTPRGATTLVAVGGRGGSGKSTLVRALRDADPSITLVHLDDLHRPGHTADADGIAWDKVVTILDVLRAGQSATYRRLDWDADALAEEYVVEPGGVVVLDGVAAIRGVGGVLDDPYDFTVWVECDETVAMERGVARDGEHARHYWERWVPLERGGTSPTNDPTRSPTSSSAPDPNRRHKLRK